MQNFHWSNHLYTALNMLVSVNIDEVKWENKTQIINTIANITSTKGTMDPEWSARNSCNSWPLYARWADQRVCFG